MFSLRNIYPEFARIVKPGPGTLAHALLPQANQAPDNRLDIFLMPLRQSYGKFRRALQGSVVSSMRRRFLSTLLLCGDLENFFGALAHEIGVACMVYKLKVTLHFIGASQLTSHVSLLIWLCSLPFRVKRNKHVRLSVCRTLPSALKEVSHRKGPWFRSLALRNVIYAGFRCQEYSKSATTISNTSWFLPPNQPVL